MVFWPTYLPQGGGGIFTPLGIFNFLTQKSGYKGKTVYNPMKRQLVRRREKNGSIPPKLGPYRANENFRQNVENRDSAQKACFQEF